MQSENQGEIQETAVRKPKHIPVEIRSRERIPRVGKVEQGSPRGGNMIEIRQEGKEIMLDIYPHNDF